jgi:hypothetical protein
VGEAVESGTGASRPRLGEELQNHRARRGSGGNGGLVRGCNRRRARTHARRHAQTHARTQHRVN